MDSFDFQLEMQVRDYECDIQGIVNNAVYQNYLEHCRHQFLLSAGLSFARLHDEGYDAVVIRAELDYKVPLRPGDRFLVRLKIVRKGRLRLIFKQQILRKADDQLVADAKITTVLTHKGRPVSFEILEDKFREAGIEIHEEPPA